MREPEPLAILRPRDTLATLGMAIHFLAQREPFASFPSKVLATTVDGEIRRGHYLMAFEGRRLVGFIGWVMLSHATAERFARSLVAPAPEEMRGEDVAWILTVGATSRAVLVPLVRAARHLHPHCRVMGVRHRPNGPPRVLRSGISDRGRGVVDRPASDRRQDAQAEVQ